MAPSAAGLGVGDGDDGAVVSEVGAGTALLAQLAAVKRATEVPSGKPVQHEKSEEDPMGWLQPKPGSPDGQDNDGGDALSFFVAAGQ